MAVLGREPRVASGVRPPREGQWAPGQRAQTQL